MGRYHSDLMLDLFPTQRPTGIDLGNVEIKECRRNKYRKFTLKPSDRYAEFFLFYDWQEDRFYFVNRRELPPIRSKRSISIGQVRKWAYFSTQDIDELMEEMASILRDLSFLPDGYREEAMLKQHVSARKGAVA